MAQKFSQSENCSLKVYAVIFDFNKDTIVDFLTWFLTQIVLICQKSYLKDDN